MRTESLLMVLKRLGMLMLPSVFIFLITPCGNAYAQADRPVDRVFLQTKFTNQDAVFVSDETGKPVFQWQAEQTLIPASVTKLLSAALAVDKWGLAHRFKTAFYLHGKQLWVKGYGDPYLISEELDLVVESLMDLLAHERLKNASSIELKGAVMDSIYIDSNYFNNQTAPGRSGVSDPYNAPLSAVAANFNTVMVRRENQTVVSAEAQTPLTKTAMKIAKREAILSDKKAVRLNLVNADFSQQHFAELLLAKMNKKEKANNSLYTGLLSNKIDIQVNQTLPKSATLLYRHFNSHDLADVLTGALKYSNNFIANQLFLMLGESVIDENTKQSMSFGRSAGYVRQQLAEMDGDQDLWANAQIVDGAGLSRGNQLSALQLNAILDKLKPHKNLLKSYSVSDAQAFAKSGTLNKVHSFAGFLKVQGRDYQFVFIFNRKMPYKYRESLLAKLANDLRRAD